MKQIKLSLPYILILLAQLMLTCFNSWFLFIVFPDLISHKEVYCFGVSLCTIQSFTVLLHTLLLLIIGIKARRYIPYMLKVCIVIGSLICLSCVFVLDLLPIFILDRLILLQLLIFILNSAICLQASGISLIKSIQFFRRH